jgi:hypothetical protein
MEPVSGKNFFLLLLGSGGMPFTACYESPTLRIVPRRKLLRQRQEEPVVLSLSQGISKTTLEWDTGEENSEVLFPRGLRPRQRVFPCHTTGFMSVNCQGYQAPSLIHLGERFCVGTRDPVFTTVLSNLGYSW